MFATPLPVSQTVAVNKSGAGLCGVTWNKGLLFIYTQVIMVLCKCYLLFYFEQVVVVVQVHSFTGSADDVVSFVDLGFYIGINGW